MSFDRDDLDAQSYEIIEELRVRNILEERTDWQYEFTKNGRYDYDLVLFDWGDSPRDDESRELIGYVEIEVANEDSDWQSGEFPSHWDSTNLLARKVYSTERRGAQLSWGRPKSDYWRTVYLKFNHCINNCFAIAIDDAHRAVQYDDGEINTWYQNSPRNWTFLELNPDDDRITYGVDESVEFITNHLSTVASVGRETDIGAFRRGRGDSDD